MIGENIANNKVSNIPVDLTEQLRANRAVVVMDIVESERAHVTELKTLIQSFLIPLKNSNMYLNFYYFKVRLSLIYQTLLLIQNDY